MTTNKAGYIHWAQAYGPDHDHATAEVDPLAKIGDLVLTPTLTDSDRCPVYRIAEILTDPYDSERPWSPPPRVIRVRLEHLYTVPGHADRTIATDGDRRRKSLSATV